MAFTSHQLTSLCLILLTAGLGSEAACTNDELDELFTCITPYNTQFFTAIGTDSSTCNPALITSALCSSFADIVTCVNGKNVSDVTCRPGAVAEINPKMAIPCKVEDFEAVCTDAPAIYTGVTTAAPTTTPASTTTTGDGGSGAASTNRGDTTLLWLVTAFFVTVHLADKR